MRLNFIQIKSRKRVRKVRSESIFKNFKKAFSYGLRYKFIKVADRKIKKIACN
jgi:hypothetical protein